MKFLIAALVMVVSQSSYGSFIQVYCSNAEAAVLTANGHVENFLKLTKRKVLPGEGYSSSIIEFDRYGIVITELAQSELKTESSSSCKEDDTSGVAFWERHYASEVSITKSDGSRFDEDIIGVSDDGKSVSAYLICKDTGNSLVICNH